MNTKNRQLQTITCSMGSGEQISFPLGRIQGSGSGPVLSVIAGIHGGEYCGIEAAIQLYNCFDPASLRGEVRIIPVANVAGLMSKTMFVSPQDGKKLSRAFPGNMNGSYTEKLAAMIFRELIEPSDFLVEFRGGEIVEAMAHYISFQRTMDETYNTTTRQLAEQFGARNVILRQVRRPGPAESAYGAATFAGKVGLLAEAGSHGLRLKEDVDFLVSGVLAITGSLGMIDRNPGPPLENHVYMNRFIDVRSPAEGIFDCTVALDEMVTQGQELGTIRDFSGQVIAKITAPAAGVVLGIVTAAGVCKDVTVIGIGAVADSENFRKAG
jgi:predicted deacylase